MTIHTISKRYFTRQEYYASPEFKEVYRGYENNIAMAKKVDESFTFLGGYVVDADPDTNYGQPFKLLKHYQCPDQLIVLKEESLIHSLDNGPLYQVNFTDTEIRIGGMPFEKNRTSRRQLIMEGITVF